ncbi:MAG: hypothetical protein MHMPM18_001085 [Marteilia pararefringens]
MIMNKQNAIWLHTIRDSDSSSAACNQTLSLKFFTTSTTKRLSWQPSGRASSLYSPVV